MTNLGQCRQRNARLELSNVNADPETLLATLHAERESAAEEARRKAEEEEDDAMVAQYFSKIPTTRPDGTDEVKGKSTEKGKQKAKNGADEQDGEASDKESASGSEEDTALPSLTIKRRPATGTTIGAAEPTVASLLAAKGKVFEQHGRGTASNSGSANATAAVQQQIKRKREGMQKLLGIKKKAKV